MTSKVPPPSLVAVHRAWPTSCHGSTAAASVTDVTCGGTTRRPRDVATSQPSLAGERAPGEHPLVGSGEASTATRTGSGGRAKRRRNEVEQAHGVSPPIARSRSERACCSSATS